MLTIAARPLSTANGTMKNRPRSNIYASLDGPNEMVFASAAAEVMLYNDNMKQWDGAECLATVNIVQITQNPTRHLFRIVAVTNNNAQILDCNIHHKLKYHAATTTFHQWRDERRQVYGLNFRSEAEARTFITQMGQVIDYLNHQHLNGQSDYQTIPADNVYQDPHAHHHLTHNQSAPAFRDQEDPAQIHANFRQSNHSMQSQSQQIQQQQRRTSQSSNVSSNGNGSVYTQQPTASSSTVRSAPPAPPAPPAAAPPPAPPPPPANLMAHVNAPPPPPPPPPPSNVNIPAPQNGRNDLLASIRNAGQNSLRKTGGPAKERSQSLAESSSSKAPPPAPVPVAAGGTDMVAELQKKFNQRKQSQAQADAADSKSNISNGSSDSGCGIPPPTNGLKKWEPVKTNGTTDSPKTHRKAPSGSSLSSQEDLTPKNGITTNNSAVLTPEVLERFKAELMVEVRLEINKAKQEIIEALRTELARR